MSKYSTKKEETKEQTTYVVKVNGAKIVGEGRVKFNADVNGVTLYGLNLIEGKNGPFISFPQWKSSTMANDDGSPKWYKHCYFPADSVINDIVAQIDEQLK